MKYNNGRRTLSFLDNKCVKLVVCSSSLMSTSTLQEQPMKSVGPIVPLKGRVGKSQQIKPQERNKQVPSFRKYVFNYDSTIRHTQRNL